MVFFAANAFVLLFFILTVNFIYQWTANVPYLSQMKNVKTELLPFHDDKEQKVLLFLKRYKLARSKQIQNVYQLRMYYI